MKRLWTAFTAATVLNAAALIGLAVYAAMNHWLEPDRVRRAWAALKDESASPTSQPFEAVAVEGIPKPEDRPTVEKIRIDESRETRARLELDRRKVEIENAWKLLEAQQLALVREREALQEEQTRWHEQRRAQTAGGEDPGLQKELEILGGLKPKLAKDLLRQKPEADTVALLKAMEERKVRKIVGECKNEEERRWIGRILEQLHDRTLTQAEVLSGDSEH